MASRKEEKERLRAERLAAQQSDQVLGDGGALIPATSSPACWPRRCIAGLVVVIMSGGGDDGGGGETGDGCATNAHVQPLERRCPRASSATTARERRRPRSSSAT